MSDKRNRSGEPSRRDPGAKATSAAAVGQQQDMVVTFRGLCSLIKRDDKDKYEAYLPTGEILPVNDACGLMAMKHTAFLTIDITAINIKDTSWAPTFIVYHAGVQVGCWDISGKQIEFTAGDNSALKGIPRWTNRHRSIDFRTEHGLDAQDRGTLTGYGYGVIDLSSGYITCAEDQTLKVCRAQVNCNTRDVAQEINWLPNSGEGLIARYTDGDGAHSIIIKRPTTLTVTNAAAPGAMPNTGAEHFVFYYTMLTNPPPCEQRITLEAPQRTLRASPDVYDCVPPIPGS